MWDIAPKLNFTNLENVIAPWGRVPSSILMKFSVFMGFSMLPLFSEFSRIRSTDAEIMEYYVVRW